MALSAVQLDVLRFIDENGGTSQEGPLAEHFPIDAVHELAAHGYLERQGFTLAETQSPEEARMPKGEVVVFKLAAAGRDALQES